MNIEDLRTYESIAMTLQSVSDSVRDVRLGRANQEVNQKSLTESVDILFGFLYTIRVG